MQTTTFVRLAALLGAATALVVAGCGQQPAKVAAPVAANADWTSYVNQYIEDYFKAQPMFAVYQGRHEFDGQLPDLSKAGLDAEASRLQAERSKASGFDPASLSDAQRFERDYLISRIDADLFWLTKAEAPYRNPDFYIGQIDPDVYLSRNYAPLDVRIKAYTAYARGIPAIAADVRANLRLPQARALVDYAVKGFGGYADFYASDVPKVFADVKDPALLRDFRQANAAAVKAMRGLRDWFVSLRRTADDSSYALGADLYAAMLHDTELVDTPIADIEAAGRADLERNQADLKEVCARFAPGKSIRECVDREHADKPKEGVVQMAREQLAGLKEFILQKGLVTIPSDDTAEVEESPPYNSANTAYISIPGPYEKNVPAVYYISPPDKNWSPKERAQYVKSVAEVLNTTTHEVWPGHFLQYLHSNRCESLVGRLWVSYAYAEGWAHYTEEMMRVAGSDNGSDELHIAQLTDALMRDARLLSAIGLHTKGMTIAQSEKLFTDEAFTDVGLARQQAARGARDPAYLNYTLGKLAIKKLRADWTARQMQGKTDQDPQSYLRQFHDQFLSYGGPPIPLVRRAMMGADGPLL